jgi:penicillin-binding protein 1B
MPLFILPLINLFQLALLKIIKIKKAMIIASFFCLFFSSSAWCFNPFNLKSEFEQKLSQQQILASTKYYAYSNRFKIRQILTEDEFSAIFGKNSYRLRTESQTLLNGDFSFLSNSACLSEIALATVIQPVESWKCVKWVNKAGLVQVIVTDNNEIIQIFKGSPLAISTEGVIDPQLIAQFKNGEPLLQDQKKIAEIPVQCMNAVMAIEDNDFLDHSGISYTGLLRAVLKNIMSLRKAQGGSTITQQLVKNYFLTPEKSFTRKIKEIYMAIRLEHQWTKDEILETYLNIIYMGQSGVFQVRGFPSASQYYFGQPIEQINLAQCALLAAIINNPLQNNPWKNKDKALLRRRLVLNKMLELQLIDNAEFKTADQQPLPEPNTLKLSETAPYYFEAVRSQALSLGINPEGKSFYTALDLELQTEAQKSLTSGISKVTETKLKLKSHREKGLELQGAVLSSENSTGLVRAFVGGQNYKLTQFNRALNSKRQIGSLIKPFIYLAGMIYSDYHPDTLVQDQPFTWSYEKQNWSPENYDKKFRGPVPYYYALKESLNSPTAQIAQNTKLENIIPLLERFGFTSHVPSLPSIALGVSEHSPLEVLQSYQTLARLGSYLPLSFIEQVTNENNELIYTHQAELENKTIEAADLIKTSTLVSMLKTTLQTGTAKSASTKSFAAFAAGKTGTTNQGRDSWFAGFTAAMTTVVWVGFDQNQPTFLTGASGALPIWTNYMAQVVPPNYSQDFNWPMTMKNQQYEFSEVHESVSFMIQ